MNNKTVNLLKIYFNHIKLDLIISICGLFIIFIAFKLFEGHDIVKVFVLTLSFIYVITLNSSFSILPNARSSSIDTFNWKYIFNLPLTPRDKVNLISCIELVSSLPLIIFTLLFSDYIISKATENVYHVRHIVLAIDCILLTILFSLKNFSNAITLPKKQMQKFDNLNIVFHRLHKISLYFMYIILSAVTFYYLDYYNIIAFKHFEIFLEKFLHSFQSWPMIIYLALFILLIKKSIIKKLTTEVSNYTPPTTYNVRVNLIKTFLFSLFSAIIFYRFYTTTIYLNQIIEEKDYQKINVYLKENKNQLNKNKSKLFNPMQIIIQSGLVDALKMAEAQGGKLDDIYDNKNNSHHGFNSMYLAIDSNNLDMIKYIEAKGFELNYKTPLANYHPIHFVLAKCQPEIIDYYLSKNINLELKNHLGETPILVAVRRQCLYGIMKLKILKVDLKVKNKDSQDISQYVDKHIKDKDIKALLKFIIQSPN